MISAAKKILSPSALALIATLAVCGSAHSDVLKGRIEELSGPNEPRLPEFKMMTPKLDGRGQEAPKKDTVAVNKPPASYPIYWRGDWGGELKIVSARYAPPPEVLAEETNKEKQLNVPGRTGKAKFKFEQLPSNQISLDPVTIEFVYPRDVAPPEPIILSHHHAPEFRRRRFQEETETVIVPSGTYFINLNSFENGITLGGNFSSQKVLNNSVKSLARNVIEQDIVSRNLEEVHGTDQVITEYSEDVLRFTMMSERLMLVQAASLSYNDKGSCQSVLSLVGYIHRM